MAKRERDKLNANDDDQKRSRAEEHPSRPDAEPDTLEGPGTRHLSKDEEDARNKATRRGEQ